MRAGVAEVEAWTSVTRICLEVRSSIQPPLPLLYPQGDVKGERGVDKAVV